MERKLVLGISLGVLMLVLLTTALFLGSSDDTGTDFVTSAAVTDSGSSIETSANNEPGFFGTIVNFIKDVFDGGGLGASGGCVNLVDGQVNQIVGTVELCGPNYNLAALPAEGMFINLSDDAVLDCRGSTIMNAGAGAGAAVIYYNAANTVVRNCIIQGFSTGFNIGGSGGSTTIYNNTFINIVDNVVSGSNFDISYNNFSKVGKVPALNQFRFGWYDSVSFGVGVMNSNFTNNVMEGGSFYMSGGDGDGGDMPSDECVIHENNFTNSGSNLIEGTTDSNFTNNYIESSIEVPFYLTSGTQNVWVNSNQIIGIGRAVVQDNSIGIPNIWDGNYYSSTDVCAVGGVSADTNEDGVGELAYTIPGTAGRSDSSPQTSRTVQCSDDDNDNTYDNADCICPGSGYYADCDDTDAATYPPYAGLSISADATLCSGEYDFTGSTDTIVTLAIGGSPYTVNCDGTILTTTDSPNQVTVFSMTGNDVTLNGCNMQSFFRGPVMGNMASGAGQTVTNCTFNSSSPAVNSGSMHNFSDNLIVVGMLTTGTSTFNDLVVQGNTFLSGSIALDPSLGEGIFSLGVNITNNSINYDQSLAVDAIKLGNMDGARVWNNVVTGIATDRSINLNSITQNCLIYNNVFNVSNTAGDSARDKGTNNAWNTTLTVGTNIIGGPNIGGNYYTDSVACDNNDYSVVADTDGTPDGIGNAVWTIDTGVTDDLPLTTATTACIDADSDGVNSNAECSCNGLDCNDGDASILPPYAGIEITSDTTFCVGEYELDDPTENDGSSAAIAVGGNGDVTLDCNGAVLYTSVKGPSTGGIDLVNGLTNPTTITNCVLKGYSSGITLGPAGFNTGDIHVNECTFNGSNIAISDGAGGPRLFNISNNVFNTGAVVIQGGRSKTVVDNNLINSGSVQGYIGGPFTMTNINVTNNNITGPGWPVTPIFFDQTDGAIITGNIVDSTDGVVAISMGSDSANCLIYNNNFTSIWNVGGTDAGTGNVWNIGKTAGTNIIGGSNLGGNYWSITDATPGCSTVADTDADGLGNTAYSLGSTSDALPLTSRSVQCVAAPDNDGDGYTTATDCDDTNASVYPPSTTGISITTDTTLCPGTYNYAFTTTGHQEIAVSFAANDITLDCNGAVLNSAGNGGDGIAAYGSNGITIKNCVFQNFDMAFGVNNLQNTLIDNNVITRSNAGGHGIENSFSMNGVNITNNNITMGTGAAIALYVSLNSGTGNIISNNILTASTSGGSGLGIWGKGAVEENWIISGNTFTGPEGGGFNNAMYLDNVSYCNITDNTFTNSNHESIFFNQANMNNIISGNLIENAGEDGIEVSSGSSNNLITGNTIIDSCLDGGGAGIYIVDDSDDNEVSENVILDGGESGIHIGEAADNLIHNNNISGTGGTGINLDDAADDNWIYSNNVTGSVSEEGAYLGTFNPRVYGGTSYHLSDSTAMVIFWPGDAGPDTINTEDMGGYGWVTGADGVNNYHLCLINYDDGDNGDQLNSTWYVREDSFADPVCTNFAAAIGAMPTITVNSVDYTEDSVWVAQGANQNYLSNFSGSTTLLGCEEVCIDPPILLYYLSSESAMEAQADTEGNVFFDNYFDADSEVLDDSEDNSWNTSYNTAASYGLASNIIGGDYIGGNYWATYEGSDDGSNGRPAGDGIGDTGLPYDGDGGISGNGDWYPLVGAGSSSSSSSGGGENFVCGNGGCEIPFENMDNCPEDCSASGFVNCWMYDGDESQCKSKGCRWNYGWCEPNFDNMNETMLCNMWCGECTNEPTCTGSFNDFCTWDAERSQCYEEWDDSFTFGGWEDGGGCFEDEITGENYCHDQSPPNCNLDYKSCDSGFDRDLGKMDGESVCFDLIDNDNNGFTDCDDPGCFFAPACYSSYDSASDNTSLQVRSWESDGWPDGFSVHWMFNKPANYTFDFYNKDPTCGTLNISMEKEDNPWDSWDDFMMDGHAIVDLFTVGSMLPENTTFFFKIFGVDMGGNNVTTACLNSSTEALSGFEPMEFNFSGADMFGMEFYVDGELVDLSDGNYSTTSAKRDVLFQFDNGMMFDADLSQAASIDFESAFTQEGGSSYDLGMDSVYMSSDYWDILSQNMGVASVNLSMRDCPLPPCDERCTPIRRCTDADPPVCSIVTDDVTSVVVNSSHCNVETSLGFSTYVAGTNSQMNISDDTDTLTKNPNDLVNFFANYTNITDDTAINPGVYTGVGCNITISELSVSNYPMEWNGTSELFEYNTTAFSSAGTYDWIANCTATLFDNLNATDQVTITAAAGAVPEFSDYAIALLLLTVVGGFFFMRRRGM